MEQFLQDYVTASQAAFTQINTSLDGITASAISISEGVTNVADDEQNLAKMIQDLKDQIAAGSSTLTQADKDAFNTVLATATSSAQKTTQAAANITSLAAQIKNLADAVPDLPPPPPSPQV